MHPPPPTTTSTAQQQPSSATPIMATFPSPSSPSSATKTHRQYSFLVTTTKLPILKSDPIDALGARLGIPIPEMIFGDNLLSLTHVPSGWSLSFSAEPALDLVDKTGASMLKVAYASEWSATREKTSAGIKEVVKPFDWSYSTSYRGTETRGANGEALAKKKKAGEGKEGKEGKEEKAEKAEQIPLELLRRRDPILFADEVVLYESELDDNGISVLSVKVRVMEQRMLILCRFFMRLDNVVVRVRDTRVYADFGDEKVIREWTSREDKFENVKRNLYMSGLMPDAITVALRDSNQIANLLPVVEHEVESVSLKSA